MASTMSNSGAVSMTSRVAFITSYLVPARVRSTIPPWFTSTPRAARRARVSSVGGTTETPRTPNWSTAMAAPPPVVVTTPTVGLRPGWLRRRSTGRRDSSGSASRKPSRVSTRAMPQSRKKVSATASSPARAPVWETASSAATSERPSL
ncbi:hypothetical protein FQZ97_826460 [compost metagenome]